MVNIVLNLLIDNIKRDQHNIWGWRHKESQITYTSISRNGSVGYVVHPEQATTINLKETWDINPIPASIPSSMPSTLPWLILSDYWIWIMTDSTSWGTFFHNYCNVLLSDLGGSKDCKFSLYTTTGGEGLLFGRHVGFWQLRKHQQDRERGFFGSLERYFLSKSLQVCGWQKFLQHVNKLQGPIYHRNIFL